MDSQNARSNILPRRRTAYACVSCRGRKTRCDGQEPCSGCVAFGVECSYDHEAVSTKGKSDLILNAISKLEQAVANIDANVSSLQQDFATLKQTPPQPPFSPEQERRSDAGTLGLRSRSFGGTSPGEDVHEFTNATISNHTSTTEAILHWPIFDDFPDLRREDVLRSGAIFCMENSRERSIRSEATIPYLSEDELDRLISAFSRTVNFSYPIVSQTMLESLKYQYSATGMDSSIRTCLTLLIMALGCAAETVHNVSQASDARKLVRLRHLGRVYFDAAVTRLHSAYSTINNEAILCLALTALYYAYLQRPIQAWSMLSSTATACRVIMSYNVLDSDSAECVRRVFWMCFILESDYLAELPALPHFGIAEIEASVPLPGHFTTHDDAMQDEMSSVYFLACISMRRLLNRCHHLLFGQQNDKMKARRLAETVSELDQQLEDWRRLLPPAIQFAIDTEPVPSQHGAFLRQRYLTCLALIHRPYIIQVLSDYVARRHSDEKTIAGAQRCLQACTMHILNLQPFDQTVIVDMWICSLSMAGTMMILLVASRIPPLADCIGGNLLVVGPHLLTLFEQWADIHGEGRSPSVQQAIEWIRVVDTIMQHA